jgi:hypothetical protein
MINAVPENLQIKIQDLMVLYVNLYLAKDEPTIGFQDCDNQFKYILKTISERTVTVRHTELESLLWACVNLEEMEVEGKLHGKFWHPHKSGVNQFIQRMIHQNTYKFHFDKIYCFFRTKKPDQGTPPDQIVSINMPKTSTTKG